jgi:hypothetical protein
VTSEVSDWLGGRAVALAGLAPGSGTEDLQPFADALAAVRVIGLGPRRGSDGLAYLPEVGRSTPLG